MTRNAKPNRLNKEHVVIVAPMDPKTGKLVLVRYSVGKQERMGFPGGRVLNRDYLGRERIDYEEAADRAAIRIIKDRLGQSTLPVCIDRKYTQPDRNVHMYVATLNTDRIRVRPTATEIHTLKTSLCLAPAHAYVLERVVMWLQKT